MTKLPNTRFYHIDPTEVDYEEMIDLVKMDRQERDEIRGRLGYKKTIDACKQPKKDGLGVGVD